MLLTDKNEIRQASIITGVSMIFMIVFAGISVGFVNGELLNDDNPINTVTAIRESLALFSFGIFGWLMIILCDIILSWSLYLVFKKVNATLSLLAMLFRLMYTVCLTVATFQLIQVTRLIELIETNSFTTEILVSSIAISLDLFQTIWYFGLILFGFHLYLIGWLSVKTSTTPSLFGYLLYLASLSYIAVHSLYTFFPTHESLAQLLEFILIIPMTIGELGIGLWLLFKGGKQKKE